MELFYKSAALKDTFENYVLNVFEGIDGETPARLAKGMRYSVEDGGKRIRPLLFLKTAQALGVAAARALPIAFSLECIHCASLIHDDLPCIDNDNLRRGRPSNHAAFGEASGVINGDALLNFAYEHLFKNAAPSDTDYIKSSAYVSLSAGSGGMLGGQYLDIHAEGAQRTNGDGKLLQRIHDKKTAALFRAALVGAAMLSGADAPLVSAFEQAASVLGAVFQIADDISDAVSTSVQLGKSAGKDADASKLTFVTLYGLDRAQAYLDQAKKEFCSLVDGLQNFTFDAKPVDAQYLLQTLYSIC